MWSGCCAAAVKPVSTIKTSVVFMIGLLSFYDDCAVKLHAVKLHAGDGGRENALTPRPQDRNCDSRPKIEA
jgi:hypothetical protein